MWPPKWFVFQVFDLFLVEHSILLYWGFLSGGSLGVGSLLYRVYFNWQLEHVFEGFDLLEHSIFVYWRYFSRVWWQSVFTKHWMNSTLLNWPNRWSGLFGGLLLINYPLRWLIGYIEGLNFVVAFNPFITYWVVAVFYGFKIYSWILGPFFARFLNIQVYHLSKTTQSLWKKYRNLCAFHFVARMVIFTLHSYSGFADTNNFSPSPVLH